ncbi:MAG: type II toxin-antitoxin system RelE/ParE family toxin [Alphaproteobacteria bacterium]|nr:type II toxin-antitoxin system RelE/ParE family toxin [Alphaproteobacteria bacterium]
MKIQQTLSFKSKVKKLHQNQLKELEAVIKKICNSPRIGMRKKGDLSEVYVYKFNMGNSLHLIAYSWDDKESLLTLLQLGVHKNFYRDLKP